MISVILVYEKTTVEKGRQARPNHILPVPPMLQFTKANPLFSSLEARPCAVTAPFMTLAPGATGLAIEVIWQPCRQFIGSTDNLSNFKKIPVEVKSVQPSDRNGVLKHWQHASEHRCVMLNCNRKSGQLYFRFLNNTTYSIQSKKSTLILLAPKHALFLLFYHFCQLTVKSDKYIRFHVREAGKEVWKK